MMVHRLRTAIRTAAAAARSLPAPARVLIGVLGAAVAVSGCQVSELAEGAHMAPIPGGLQAAMRLKDMSARSPLLIRIYKSESELEVWKPDRSGRFEKLKTYEICAWSGKLGPKLKEGDRQAPEGFYTVSPGQMNPNSSYHLAFNMGFPNTFDRSHGRTGSHLMVHGDCSSRGCYAMEDGPMEEIYALAREAFRGGQRAFQVQAFPFRMTPENMAKHADSEHMPFWQMLKEGSDHFEATRRVPQVDVCGRRYVFNAASTAGFSARADCPAFEVRPDVERLVADKRAADAEKFEVALARLKDAEARKQRWEEREQAIASFFDRSGEDDVEADESRAGEVVADAPVPAPAPPSGRTGRGTVVASTAGALAEPQTAAAAPSRETAEVETAAAPAPALGYAPAAPAEDDAGFFGGLAKTGKGLFGKATSLFD